MAENHTEQDSQQPVPKTSRLKIAAILVLLVCALLVLKLVLLLTAKPTISVDYLAEFNRISRPTDYDPNQNAAPYYQKAFDVLNSMSPDRQDIWRVRPADMNDSQIEFLESWLESNSEALGYLKQAVQKPYYWIQVHSQDNSLVPIDLSHLAKLRQAAYCLMFQAMLKTAKGHPEQAFDSVIILKEMAAHLYDSKLLVSQLVARAVDGLATNIAFEILDNSEIDSKTLADFQSRFEQSSQVQKRIPFAGDKIFDYAAIQRVFTDDGSGDGRLIPHQLFRYRGYLNLRGAVSKPRFYFTIAGIYLKTVWAAFNHPTRRQTLELVEEVYGLLDELVKKTPWQMFQQGTSYDQELQNLTHDNYFLRSKFARRGRICQIYHRCNAGNSALIATIALLRYKADKNRLPDSLEQLVSDGYLKELPMDPFGPGPLIYKLIGDDFKLYSFGLDFDDDGGIGYRWGMGEEGGDQVFWPIKQAREKDKQK